MMKIAIRHWMPILTYCPVNNLPDLVYVTVWYRLGAYQTPPELYAIRRRIRKLIGRKKGFMEDLARHLLHEFQEAYKIEVRLAFNRHYVEIRR